MYSALAEPVSTSIGQGKRKGNKKLWTGKIEIQGRILYKKWLNGWEFL